MGGRGGVKGVYMVEREKGGQGGEMLGRGCFNESLV